MTTAELNDQVGELSKVRLGFMLAYINGAEPELVERALAFVRDQA